MVNRKFDPSLVVKVLEQHASGVSIEQLIALHGLSETTIYDWRSRYAGLNEKQLIHLRKLEAENKQLRIINSRLDKEHRSLSDMVKKKL